MLNIEYKFFYLWPKKDDTTDVFEGIDVNGDENWYVRYFVFN